MILENLRKVSLEKTKISNRKEVIAKELAKKQN
jgi:hypothetical protein